MEGDDQNDCEWCEGFDQHDGNCLYQDIDLSDSHAMLLCPNCRRISSPCPCKPTGMGHSICGECEMSHRPDEQCPKLLNPTHRNNSPRDGEHWGCGDQSQSSKIKTETVERSINDIDLFASRKEKRRGMLSENCRRHHNSADEENDNTTTDSVEQVDSRRACNANGYRNINGSIKSLTSEINRRVGQVHRRFAETDRFSRVLMRRLDNVDLHLGDIQESLDGFSVAFSAKDGVNSSVMNLRSAADKGSQRLYEKNLIGMEKLLKKRFTKLLKREVAKHNKAEKKSRFRSESQEKHILREMDNLRKKIESLEDFAYSTQQENEMRNDMLLAMVPEVITMKSAVTSLLKESSEFVNVKEKRGNVSPCKSKGKQAMRTDFDIHQPWLAYHGRSPDPHDIYS